MSRHHSQRIGRTGFTILELVVATGIIGMLIALLIPAVQSSREAARRLSCTSNLHQVLIAFHNHADAHGVLPGQEAGLMGWKMQILPYIDQAIPDVDSNGSFRGESPYVSIYRCPSDPLAGGRLSAGSHSYYPSNGHGNSQFDGIYTLDGRRRVRPRDVVDGLSSTAAVSERLATPDQEFLAAIDLADAVLNLRILRITPSAAPDLDTLASECQQRSTPPELTLVSSSSYNHIQLPNRRSCVDGPLNGPLGPTVSTTSFHPGGVNLALGDGAVRFVSDSIDLSVWRAIGTRNGAEAVSNF